VGTPRSLLKKFEEDFLRDNWIEVQPGLEVKSCKCPDGTKETYILCRSPKRGEKEKAMRERSIQGMEKSLQRLKISAEKGRIRDRGKAERRVGRLFQKYSRAAKFYEVKISEFLDPQDKRKKQLCVCWKKRHERSQWAELSDGCYLLRTNIKGKEPEELWRIYMGLTKVEDSFRITKYDLGLRPVYHQKENRTQAHILVCFLALAMWRTLENWMDSCDLGTAPRKLIEEMREVYSLDVVLKTDAGKEVRLRVVTRPEKRLVILLKQLNFPLPNKPKRIPNVVATLP
jgi:transposase